MTSTPIPAIFGCDVGKTEIVVHDLNAQTTRKLPNDADALKKFAAELPSDAFVVCEATGGYETGLLEAVAQAGRRAHRAHPRQVKTFIRSLGQFAKTDALDAMALARYGAERHAALEPWTKPDKNRQRLHDLVMTRRDCVAQRVAWNNRLKAPGGQAVAALLAPLIAALDKALRNIKAEIEHILKQDRVLKRNADALEAIKGIGAITAANLLALMPELGTLNRRTAAALAGLAPYANQSGSRDGYRRTKGGRPEVKRTLFMAAMVAAKHNTALKTFYQRLIANGKKPLIALTAIMRKLIIFANAAIRDSATQQVS